jgi:hypothetical protein
VISSLVIQVVLFLQETAGDYEERVADMFEKLNYRLVKI